MSDLTDEQRLAHLAALRKQSKPSGLTPARGHGDRGDGFDSEIGRDTNQIPGRSNPIRTTSDLVDGIAGNVEHLLRWKVRSRRELAHIMLIAVLACGSSGLFGAVLGGLAVLVASH